MPSVNSTMFTMSNYSVYFLMEQNTVNLNCSVYSLTLGLLVLQDYFSHQWLANLTDFVPAYYATNCSVPDLVAHILNQSVSDADVLRWMRDFKNNPYNISDNGDSFVALLYMILGLCVSCWMLELMFVLLPKYKRKPLLTHLATVMYLVVLTIILAQITAVSRDEYYSDTLDMIKILNIVNDKRKYPTAITILQLLTNLALVHLGVAMTRQTWKRINGAVGLLLTVANLVAMAVRQAQLDDFAKLSVKNPSPAMFAQHVCQLLIILWLAMLLAYHTLFGTASAPRQVAYSRKLVPLALLTWFLVALQFVMVLLTATLWRNDWLVRAWITFFPYVLSIYVLTCCWEWVHSIRDLELKLERVGMLGRPISMDDIGGFDASKHNRPIQRRFSAWKKMLFGSEASQFVLDKDLSSSGSSLDAQNPEGNSESVNQSVNQNVNQNVNQSVNQNTENAENSHTYTHTHTQNTDNTGAGQNANLAETAAHVHSNHSIGHLQSGSHPHSELDFEYEVEYVDDWDDAPQEGTSHDLAGHDHDDLPSFRPHPGYSIDDYWDEK